MPRSAQRDLFAEGAQRDLFAEDAQGDLFGPAPAPAYRPDPDKVRSRLNKILAEARAAERMPWEPTTLSLYQLIFPQMTGYLPEAEGAQFQLEFEAEVARLQAG